MADKSLWIVSETGGTSAQPIIDFLINQAMDLANQTDGKVIAEFIIREDTAINMLRVLSRIGQGIDEIMHADGAQSASTMYAKMTYDFFITDKYNQYELTLFQLHSNGIMPVEIIIDDTIAYEAKVQEKEQIKTLEDLEAVFKKIVRTNKVIYIISRLMKLTDETAQTKPDTAEETTSQSENTDSEGKQ